MPLYTPDDPEFAALAARHAWLEHALAAACGELEDDPELPKELDWLTLLPPSLMLDIESVDCSLAFSKGGYNATLWDATGEDDFPWVTLLVDDAGVRLLSEYSVLDEDADLDALLEKASTELPERLLSGELTRQSPTLTLPDWLTSPTYKPEDK
ncbi:MAG: hypothetical protein QM758_22565 [Armatimonas sp.]